MKRNFWAVLVVVLCGFLFPALAMAEEPTEAQFTELHKLAKSGHVTATELEAFLQQNRPQAQTSHPAANLIPEGWMVVEDVPPTQFKIAELEFVSFLKGNETYISGEEMRQRAVGLKANLGLADAKFVLAHQDEIPADLRDKYLVFPGTLLRNPDGYLGVACLGWDGYRWRLYFSWLGFDWYGHYRLPRRK